MMRFNFHLWVQYMLLYQSLLGSLNFFLTNMFGCKQNLPRQVIERNHVFVNQDDFADAQSSQPQSDSRAEPSSPKTQANLLLDAGLVPILDPNLTVENAMVDFSLGGFPLLGFLAHARLHFE